MQLVTLGTDGHSNFVRLSDGTKYLLGIVTPLKFVVELAPGGRAARAALDTFLAEGSVLLPVDADRMWELLTPRRPRMSSSTAASPLIPSLKRTSLTRQGTTMADADQVTKEAIQNQIATIEGQIAVLQQHAKDASPGSISSDSMKDQIASLKDLVSWLRRPSPYGNQAQNSTFYGLPGAKQASEASFENFKAHSELVETTIARLDETDTKIDTLVAAGKKFASARAKQDIHKIASAITEIVQTVDLAQPWVKKDLAKLASQADEIHGLFAEAKV